MNLRGFWVFFIFILISLEASGQAKELTVDDCISLALKQNPQILVAEYAKAVTMGKLSSAFSNFLPKLTASGSFVHMSNLPEFKAGTPIYFPTSFPMASPSGTPLPPDHIHLIPFPSFEMANEREGDIYNFKIEASYPLFTGGRVEYGYKAAKLEVEVKKEDVEKQKLELIYQVKQAFYGVLLAQEMVEVIDQSYKTMEEHYKQVKALYKEGYVSNLDLLQVEAKLSSIKPKQIEVHNMLNLAELGLKTLLNIEQSEKLVLVGELKFEKKEVPSLDELIKFALENRPDLKTLEYRKVQTEQLYKIARAGYLPTVALFANYQWNRGQEMPPNDKIWREGWQAGASASITLFDGFATKADMDSARAQKQQVEAGLRGLRLGIEMEVTSAYLKLKSAEESVLAQEKNVAAAEKNFKTAETRYREGWVNHLDVLDAEVNLTQARADYLRAVNDYILAWASLNKAIGNLEEGK